MDVAKMMEIAAKAGESDRKNKGQVTLKYLRDVLLAVPKDTPCQFDTGHNFGLEPVSYRLEPEYKSEHFSHPEHFVASSETAYPSAYRGYYSDCTFNASTQYDISTVGHVLELIDGAIGKSFDGYKGGVNKFTENTMVWGGGTSHCSCGDSEMVVGVELVDEKCIIKTTNETWD